MEFEFENALLIPAITSGRLESDVLNSYLMFSRPKMFLNRRVSEQEEMLRWRVIRQTKLCIVKNERERATAQTQSP